MFGCKSEYSHREGHIVMRAVKDYEAKSKHEVSFVQGDRLQIIEEIDKSAKNIWLQACNLRTMDEGYIPTRLVEEDDGSPQPERADHAKRKKSKEKRRSKAEGEKQIEPCEKDDTFEGTRPQTPSLKTAQAGEIFMKALEDYFAKSKQEVSCREGDRLFIMEDDGEVENKKWLHVRNLRHHAVGYIPSRIVISKKTTQQSTQRNNEGAVAEGNQPKKQKEKLRADDQKGNASVLSSKGLGIILSYLDAESLQTAELVCKEWYRVISDGMLWKKFIEKMVRADTLWRALADRRGWDQYLFEPKPGEKTESHKFYKWLYPQILSDIKRIENNWRTGCPTLQRIHCDSKTSKGVYFVQYDEQKIVSGLRDNTIKIWDKNSRDCVRVLTGHTGSVLCLQYDKNIIISSSSDSTVRVWSITSGEILNTLSHHSRPVLHLCFSDGILVTCSKDHSIAVWDMQSPTVINLRKVLAGHRAAVNVVDFDPKYLVSGSGDRTIRVWSTSKCEFVRTLHGHKRGISCLQLKKELVASASSDNTIRLWGIESGACLRVLDGHENLVRCIRFDNKIIVSGDYDGKIKVWDLIAAMNPRATTESLCLCTLKEHSGRVLGLQFDKLQIVSCSYDDTILIWDFST